MTALSQEEILQSTRTVVQGLEALKDEHESIKVSTLITINSIISWNNYNKIIIIIILHLY